MIVLCAGWLEHEKNKNRGRLKTLNFDIHMGLKIQANRLQPAQPSGSLKTLNFDRGLKIEAK